MSSRSKYSAATIIGPCLTAIGTIIGLLDKSDKSAFAIGYAVLAVASVACIAAMHFQAIKRLQRFVAN